MVRARPDSVTAGSEVFIAPGDGVGRGRDGEGSRGGGDEERVFHFCVISFLEDDF